MQSIVYFYTYTDVANMFVNIYLGYHLENSPLF